jgi:hypothetical protein
MQISKKLLRKNTLLIHPVPSTNLDIFASVGLSENKGTPESFKK